MIEQDPGSEAGVLSLAPFVVTKGGLDGGQLLY